MSEALSYLVKARPAAMQAYFGFLKDAGSRLDPKTRNLISVITKVHAQTENGLRQYLKRALREGASADEVIDALLMAFPALGLAKIVWAVDVILRMDLPEFRSAGAVAEPVWHDVVAIADVESGKAVRVDCDGRGLFVFRKGRSTSRPAGASPRAIGRSTSSRTRLPRGEFSRSGRALAGRGRSSAAARLALAGLPLRTSRNRRNPQFLAAGICRPLSHVNAGVPARDDSEPGRRLAAVRRGAPRANRSRSP
jgi:alkylhydroperoxidase/carboxymuconolactone decarboxylase family protein YurZ